MMFQGTGSGRARPLSMNKRSLKPPQGKRYTRAQCSVVLSFLALYCPE
jgi:hypothetical protein